MDRARPPLGNRLARLRARRFDRRWREAETRPTSRRFVARLPFPEDWSILVVRPPGESGLHGPDESRAFANLPPFTQDVTDSLCRLVLLEILPAVIERDLRGFWRGTG